MRGDGVAKPTATDISNLIWLAVRRGRFRMRRTAARMASPRRIIATLATILFVIAYVAHGGWMLTSRPPADPTRLHLWLSGGMVIYAIYHAIACVYGRRIEDLEENAAQRLWVGGGPTSPSAPAMGLMIDRTAASAVKTILMMVVLWGDSPCPPRLAMAIFASLVTMDLLRLIIVRGHQMLSPRQTNLAKVAVTSVAAAMAVFVLTIVAANTPPGASPIVYAVAGASSLGSLAASDVVQWLAIPFRPAAQLAIATAWTDPSTIASGLAAIAVIPAMMVAFACVDRMAIKRQINDEQAALKRRKTRSGSGDPSSQVSLSSSRWNRSTSPWRALVDRQQVSIRRYAGTIVTSFAIPVALCLSPILSDELHARWLFVVGGVGFCTAMLAPAALKLDFRRDLKRMTLLRSMPVSATTMVTTQIALPIAITWVFQAIVLVIAWASLRPGISAMVLWSGMLPALAVTVFAIENALFLVYPHHAHSQGVSMLVRAKLTFLGKATALAVAVVGLLAWAMACQNGLPPSASMPVMVTGAVLAAWGIATATTALAIWAWRRFDLSADVPPA